MLAKLFLLFTIVPLIELFVLIPLAGQIGIPATIAIVAITALAGAILGRQQGLRAWNAVTQDLAQGALPADSIIDGLIVFAGCVLLVTPGVLTDLTGLAFLIPMTRAPIRALVKRRFAKRIEQQTWTMVTDHAQHTYYPASYTGNPEIIDITPVKK